MPRLSEPMRKALRMADQHGALIERRGYWTHDGCEVVSRPGSGDRYSWTTLQSTINALTRRGFLRHDGENRIITPAGREAIGMKEGEDRNG